MYLTNADVETTAAISSDGTQYFGSELALFALTPAGTLKWKAVVGGKVTSAPAVGPDGALYFGSNDGVVHAVEAASGSQRWSRAIGGSVTSSPSVDLQGDVYVGATDGKVYALKPADGAVLWSLASGGSVATAPAMGSDGTVYVGSADGKLYSIGGGPTVFANCVSEVGAGRFVALFGYESRLSVPATVPLGPQNKLVPTPSQATVQPPTTFQPGRTDIGLWVPMDGASVTWVLRGVTATVSTSSPRCTSAAYPKTPPGPRPFPESPGEVIAPGTPKPVPYFDPGSTSTFAAASSSASSGIGVVRQALTTLALPFTVDVDGIVNDDAFFPPVCLGPSEPYVKVSIAGGPQQRLDTSGGRCLFTPCVATAMIPVTTASVNVKIELWESDSDVCGGGDDHEVDIDVDVDNKTGVWVGARIIPSSGSSTIIGGNRSGSVTGDDDSKLFFSFGVNGPPTVTTAPRICAIWSTSYIDQLHGEDFTGNPDPDPMNARRLVPASFAEFKLDVDGPIGTFHIGPGTFLDQDGCLPAGTLPPDALLFAADAPPGDVAAGGLTMTMQYATHLRRPDGAEITAVDHRKNDELFVVVASTGPDGTPEHRIDFDGTFWTRSGAWNVPAADVTTIRDITITPMTEAIAAVTQIVKNDDMGVLPNEKYDVSVNNGCVIDGQLDSCGSSSGLDIGDEHIPTNPQACGPGLPACPSVQECGPNGRCRWPHQARWKFVTGHEAGHMFQDRAMGLLGHPYLWSPAGTACTGKMGSETFGVGDSKLLVDPPCGDILCGCEHVDAANAYHCLQSIENASAAAVEGFAQFYASKTWNRQNENDCAFVYYKEFLNPGGCPPGSTCTLFPASPADPLAQQHGQVAVIPPPLAISCNTPFKWRNTFCPMVEFGTEIDWMRFYWNVNTQGPNKSTMDDLFQIYRHACHPTSTIPANCGSDPACRSNVAMRCGGEDVGWEVTSSTANGFRVGAELNYGVTNPKYIQVTDIGDQFSISLNPAK